jgi:hypothetical protein
MTGTVLAVAYITPIFSNCGFIVSDGDERAPVWTFRDAIVLPGDRVSFDLAHGVHADYAVNVALL